MCIPLRCEVSRCWARKPGCGPHSPRRMSAPALPADDLAHVLTRVGKLWERARGTRLFLTGGTGFFGPWLDESFAHANDQLGLEAQLIVLSRDPDAAMSRLPALRNACGVTFWKGDVRNFEFPRGAVDLIVHGAAESSQQGHIGDQRHMFDTI